MHKVFISYHHKDQRYKDHLVEMARRHGIFIDRSVDTGDIDDDLPPQRIREIIRDRYLREEGSLDIRGSVEDGCAEPEDAGAAD